jgi:hypothetical protein
MKIKGVTQGGSMTTKKEKKPLPKDKLKKIAAGGDNGLFESNKRDSGRSNDSSNRNPKNPSSL